MDMDVYEIEQVSMLQIKLRSLFIDQQYNLR